MVMRSLPNGEYRRFAAVHRQAARIVKSMDSRSASCAVGAAAVLKLARLCQIAASGHVAPTPAVILREIDEEPGAIAPGANFQPVEIRCREKMADGSCGGEQGFLQGRDVFRPILLKCLGHLPQLKCLGGPPDPMVDNRQIIGLGEVSGFQGMEQAQESDTKFVRFRKDTIGHERIARRGRHRLLILGFVDERRQACPLGKRGVVDQPVLVPLTPAGNSVGKVDRLVTADEVALLPVMLNEFHESIRA
jgi:hypothetical protein